EVPTRARTAQVHRGIRTHGRRVMTAHPLALIAGIGDGIEIEEREPLDDHIASCDSCRTYARAIERVDRLITSPEPALALPPRIAVDRSRGHAITVGATVAMAVLIVVVASLARQSFQPAAQPESAQVVALGIDACDLVPARNAAPVTAATRVSFPKVPPLPPGRPGSFNECVYGFRDGWFDSHLLLRTEPTPSAEALQQWRWFLRFQDPQLTSWSTSDTRSPGGVAAVRWSTSGVTAGHEWSMIGVSADLYYFVVTAETIDGASTLADMVLDQLKQWPWPADVWRRSACMVLDRAAAQGGLSPGPGPQPTELWPHPGLGTPVFGDNVCAYGEDSGSWGQTHVFLRATNTRPDDVPHLLKDAFDAVSPSYRIDEWRLV